jgi:hypothetical protein
MAQGAPYPFAGHFVKETLGFFEIELAVLSRNQKSDFHDLF